MADPSESEMRGLLVDLALARTAIDRAEHRRTDRSWLQAAWLDPTSRVLLVQRGKFPLEGRGNARDLHWRAPRDLGPGWESALDADSDREVFFLGVDEGNAYFAVRSGPQASCAMPPSADWGDLRACGASLGDRDAGLAVTAVALDNWHATHPRCARCGAPTRVDG